MELDQEEKDAASAAQTPMASTTKLDYVLPPGSPRGEPAADPTTGPAPAAPATIWNPTGERSHNRSGKFTDGMLGRQDIDDLIATRAL